MAVYEFKSRPEAIRWLIIKLDSNSVIAEKLLAKLDPGMYHYINQGCLDVDGMDDKVEMKLADVRAPRVNLVACSSLRSPLPVSSPEAYPTIQTVETAQCTTLPFLLQHNSQS